MTGSRILQLLTPHEVDIDSKTLTRFLMIRNRERCRPIRQWQEYEHCLKLHFFVCSGQMYSALRGDGGAPKCARMSVRSSAPWKRNGRQRAHFDELTLATIEQYGRGGGKP